MTTLLCPVSFVELRVGPSETSVPCPRCATRHDAAFLRARDETLCACGHRLAAHRPRWGLAYACQTSGCGCRQPNPKETNMTATTTTHPLVQRDTDMPQNTFKHSTHEFPNGYGAEVNTGPGAYEGRDFTVTYNGEPVYDTELEDERGWWALSAERLESILEQIAALPPRT